MCGKDTRGAIPFAKGRARLQLGWKSKKMKTRCAEKKMHGSGGRVAFEVNVICADPLMRSVIHVKFDDLKMKFKIWHLLLITLVAALIAKSLEKREAFPIQTKETASKINSHDLRLIGYQGDTTGPYKYVFGYTESVPVDKTTPSPHSSWVRYQIDGQTKKYQIPAADKSTTRVNVFENRKGNHLLVIFENPW